jgi:hypothetical protein
MKSVHPELVEGFTSKEVKGFDRLSRNGTYLSLKNEYAGSPRFFNPRTLRSPAR